MKFIETAFFMALTFMLSFAVQKDMKVLAFLVAVVMTLALNTSYTQAIAPAQLAPMVLPVLFSDTQVEEIDGRNHLVFDDGELRITTPAIKSKDEITPVSIYWWQNGEWKLKAVLYGDTFDPFKGGKWTKHLRDLYLAL